ncbi:lysophospholipid acyltransferase family protein [Acidipila rosea]|uniref:1-acyl-sn-glycerol-3-phosphate acyltransferase n=1 Tax=Acidipila rosea TaxID=768535 RepID=A0A4R1L5T0_9BACT|nr:lysophospholipid acyltransferase family protein [Acidipila rosea]TCK72537.1 1-acyl-sn-glycerol-3-phosphate acyltransferase [Acidipila rosea]
MTARTLTPRPNPLPLKYRLMSALVQGPIFAAATAFMGSVALVASLFEKDGRIQHWLARKWARFTIKISISPVKLINGENLRKYPVAVYVANHLSFMDTPVLFSQLPFQFRIVARHDLWKLPFIGGWLRRSGQVPVNVDNPRASIASLSSAVKTLKSGMPLFIFPEGGRTETGHLAPFLNGPAFMAIRAQVPVIPMAIVGTYELLPIHTLQFHPEALVLAVGEPIDTSGYSMKQVDELTARLQNEVARLYYAHTYLKAPAIEAPASATATTPQAESVL